MAPASEFSAEQPRNYERKLPVVLVIDSSGSMSGARIEEVNKGLRLLEQEILADATARQRVDLCIVTFNHEVKVVREFDLVTENSMTTLHAEGNTRLVDGVREGIQRAKERIDWIFETAQDCYRPYLILLTDGEPDPGQDVEGLAKELSELTNAGYESPKSPGHPRKFNIMTVGVEGADFKSLQKISPKTPLRLNETRFQDFWLYIRTLTKSLSRAKPDQPLNISPGALGVADPFEVVS